MEFKKLIQDLKEKEELEEKQAPKPKRSHVSVYSGQHKHIPMTKTDYVRQGSKWKQVGEPERSLISRDMAQNVLDKRGLPFESSHRITKKDKYGHSYPYDTFSSVSPDKTRRTVWNVDYAQGDKNYHKIVEKSYYDRMRYKNQKKNK